MAGMVLGISTLRLVQIKFDLQLIGGLEKLKWEISKCFKII